MANALLRRTEAGAFSHLFAIATKGQQSIGGKDAVQFFLKSQVPVPVLKQIWAIAAQGQPEMQISQFNTAMRLIALAQKGVSINQQTLEQTRGMQTPLPAFQGIELPKQAPPPSSASGGVLSWTISSEAKANYAKLWEGIDKNSQGLLEGKTAAAFFAKSGHSREVLRSIWQLSDMNGDGKMDRVEFYVGMHLTKMVKMGMTLPATLPSELVASAKDGSGGGGGGGGYAEQPVPAVPVPISSSASAASSRPAPSNAAGGGALGQLNDATSQLRQEMDRLAELDAELVRLRGEVAELRSNVASKTASITNQQMLAAQKLQELRGAMNGSSAPQQFSGGGGGGYSAASGGNAFDNF